MKSEILAILKSTDGYISGEEISERFGVSRTAIWKDIKLLRSEGYEIEAVQNKGYRLASSSDTLNADELHPNTNFIGKTIIYNKVVDSTNSLAKRSSENLDGTVFIADTQTAGRGRLGRCWISPSGCGIWMSLLLKPKISPLEASQLTPVAGLSVLLALKRITGITAAIKWPNDIVVNGKKLCGILTEMACETDAVSYIVCGIGINVNNSEFDTTVENNATSVYLLTEKTQKRAPLAEAVIEEFEKLYLRFLSDGFSALRTEYEKMCINVGREVELQIKGELIRAEAVGISDDGALIIKKDNLLMNISSGEVSVRGVYGYV